MDRIDAAPCGSGETGRLTKSRVHRIPLNTVKEGVKKPGTGPG